jgi:hypothetical protein
MHVSAMEQSLSSTLAPMARSAKARIHLPKRSKARAALQFTDPPEPRNNHAT